MAASSFWRSGSKRDKKLWRPLLRSLRSETTAHGSTRIGGLPLEAATLVRSEEERKTIMEALDALSNGDQQQLQEHMRVALAEGWPRRRPLHPRLLKRRQRWTPISTRSSGN